MAGAKWCIILIFCGAGGAVTAILKPRLNDKPEDVHLYCTLVACGDGCLIIPENLLSGINFLLMYGGVVVNQINYKRLMKNALLVGIGGVVIGFLLLVLVYLLPTAPMRENVQSSIEEWNEEGAWPTIISGYSGSILDNFTDSIMQSIAIYENEESVFVKAMKNYYAVHPTIGTVGALYAYVQGEDCYGENYARYWHGYLVVLKPLLLLFSYTDLRALNMVALSLLIVVAIYLLSKRLSIGAGIVFLVSLMLLMPSTYFLCLDMANMLYVTLIALIVLLQKKDYWNKNENILIYFLAVGMCTSYMDLLTYPMIAIGVPLATYMALFMRDKKQPVTTATGFWAVVSWGAGYGGMWSAKWVLASLITGENIILDALRTVKKRSDLQTEKIDLLGRVRIVGANIDVLFQGVCGIVLVFLMMLLIAYLVRSYVKKQVNSKGLWMFLVVAAIPFMWLFVTSEHAGIHSWFTYRNLVVSVYAVGMLGVCACERKYCKATETVLQKAS